MNPRTDHAIVSIGWVESSLKETGKTFRSLSLYHPLPDRPNPIGLHRAKILQIADQCRLIVRGLEAIDGPYRGGDRDG